jgi:hypothetical protein
MGVSCNTSCSRKNFTALGVTIETVHNGLNIIKTRGTNTDQAGEQLAYLLTYEAEPFLRSRQLLSYS